MSGLHMKLINFYLQIADSLKIGRHSYAGHTRAHAQKDSRREASARVWNGVGRMLA